MVTVLGGLLAFFLLEKLVLWRHAHGHDAHRDDAEETEHEHALHAHGADQGRSGLMILIGTSVHNFCDGVVIAAAFLASTALGVATTVAIVAHAVPQQVGDFAVLVHSGFTRSQGVRLQRRGRRRDARGRARRVRRARRHAARAADGARHRRVEPALRRGRRSHSEPAPATRAARDREAAGADRTRHRASSRSRTSRSSTDRDGAAAGPCRAQRDSRALPASGNRRIDALRPDPARPTSSRRPSSPARGSSCGRGVGAMVGRAGCGRSASRRPAASDRPVSRSLGAPTSLRRSRRRSPRSTRSIARRCWRRCGRRRSPRLRRGSRGAMPFPSRGEPRAGRSPLRRARMARASVLRADEAGLPARQRIPERARARCRRCPMPDKRRLAVPDQAVRRRARADAISRRRIPRC